MIHMLVGIQGSGKSTFANKLSKQLNCNIISTDTLRKQGIIEKDVWVEVYKRCANALINNEDVIYDATNITPKVRKRFIDEIIKYNVNPIIDVYYLDTDVNICHKRVVDRNTNPNELYLPEDVVFNYYEKLIPPTLEEDFVFIKTVQEGEITKEVFNEKKYNC